MSKSQMPINRRSLIKKAAAVGGLSLLGLGATGTAAAALQTDVTAKSTLKTGSLSGETVKESETVTIENPLGDGNTYKCTMTAEVEKPSQPSISYSINHNENKITFKIDANGDGNANFQATTQAQQAIQKINVDASMEELDEIAQDLELIASQTLSTS